MCRMFTQSIECVQALSFNFYSPPAPLTLNDSSLNFEKTSPKNGAFHIFAALLLLISAALHICISGASVLASQRCSFCFCISFRFFLLQHFGAH